MSGSRASWTSRYGFYMAAIGSSFGLGNLWRFPYVVGNNGGGAFVLLYIFFAVVIGLPLLIAEFMLGKISRQSAVGSMAWAGRGGLDPAMSPAPSTMREWLRLDWPWFGRLAIFASVALLSYYAVISGWVLYFCAQFFMNCFSDQALHPLRTYKELMDSGALQMGLAAFHILVASSIVTLGVRDGIERWIGGIMTVFILLMAYLVYESLSLPGAEQAVRFLFYPDFSKFRPTTLVQVLGHVFFTLSLGMGAMITFGSYLRSDIPTPTEGVRVAALDTLISLFAGLLIFPIFFSGGADSMTGPGLLFQTIPMLMHGSHLGSFFGFLFFLCLYCAALGATVGLLESGVSNLVDRKKMKREFASLIMGAVVLLITLFPALGSTVFRSVQIGGMGILELVDSILITWILPLSALGVSLVVGLRMPRALKEAEFVSDEVESYRRLYRNWEFVLRWAAPLVILGALVLNIVGLITR